MLQPVERLCSHCGAANSLDRTECSRCGHGLVSAPARTGARTLTRWQAPGAGALALSVGVVAARVGWRVMARYILPRARGAVQRAVTVRPSQPPVESRSTEAEPGDVVLRGWRVWSVRHGDDQSSGTDTFEWRIGKK